MGEDIISFLQIRDAEQVLDIATGTGEPGLTIASLTPNGKVIGTDIAEDMLAIARENAEVKGLKNYITMLADASELPFTNQTFNAISCRMGFMFFPDMRLAAREMYRVLNPRRPDRRFGVGCAGSEQLGKHHHECYPQTYRITSTHARCAGYVSLCRTRPGRCYFKAGGIQQREGKVITGKVDYTGFDRYWEMMLEVGPGCCGPDQWRNCSNQRTKMAGLY